MAGNEVTVVKAESRQPVSYINVMKVADEIESLNAERFDFMHGGLSSGGLTASSYPRAKNIACRLDEALAKCPTISMGLNDLQRKATREEIIKSIVELTESRSNAAKGGSIYGRLMGEEVISDEPSIGALLTAVRSLWRSQHADQRAPEIGDVLDAIKEQERKISLRTKMVESLPAHREKLGKLITDYEDQLAARAAAAGNLTTSA